MQEQYFLRVRTRSVQMAAAIALLSICLGFSAGNSLLGLSKDFNAYASVYEDIRLTDAVSEFRFEPGYVFLSWFSKFVLSIDFGIFYSLLATLSILVKFSIFGKCHRPVFTTIFYVCCWYPLHEYTQIRAAVALAICFVAALCLLRWRWLSFFGAIMLAASFHASALIFAVAMPVAYFLSHFRLAPVAMGVAGGAVILSGIIPAFVAFATRFNSLAQGYAANLDGNHVNILSGANILTACLLASLVYARNLKTERDRTFFILALFGLVSAVALQAIPVFSHRIKEMFLVFLVPLVFNSALTKKTLPQYFFGFGLSAWSFYSAVANEVIGGGP